MLETLEMQPGEPAAVDRHNTIIDLSALTLRQLAELDDLTVRDCTDRIFKRVSSQKTSDTVQEQRI